MDRFTLSTSIFLNNFREWDVAGKVEEKVKDTCFKKNLLFHKHKDDGQNKQVKKNLCMLSTVLSFYDIKEECFVFGKNDGRFTVDFGLEDIMYITGLPIDGKQV